MMFADIRKAHSWQEFGAMHVEPNSTRADPQPPAGGKLRAVTQ
jgi:hypothetical protein